MRTEPYPRDLTDPQWVTLSHWSSPPMSWSGPRSTDLSVVVIAMFCRHRHGCALGGLAPRLPPSGGPVYNDFQAWRDDRRHCGRHTDAHPR